MDTLKRKILLWLLRDLRHKHLPDNPKSNLIDFRDDSVIVECCDCLIERIKK